MASVVDGLTLEVAPGVLKRVADCSAAEIISAALLLLVSDAGDELWEEQFAVVRVVAAHRLVPRADVQQREGLKTFVEAMGNLPYEVRQKIGPVLRRGIEANRAGA